MDPLDTIVKRYLITEMILENDVMDMIKHLEFKRVSNKFQSSLSDKSDKYQLNTRKQQPICIGRQI